MILRSRKSIPFYKMSGSGNDFILIDNRKSNLGKIPLGPFVRKICRQHLSVGADGLIILEPTRSKNTHFRFRLFNSDGGEAELSGNGGRCAARLAYLLRLAPKKMVFETLAGLVQAEVLEGKSGSPTRVKIEMPTPKDLRLDMKIPVKGKTFLGHYINTGVPHTVLFIDDLDKLDIVELGRSIRHHPIFRPAGTNVDFSTIRNSRSARMRSYERGVEEETLACGTGAVATAIIAAARGQASSPMTVHQQSGMPLRVYFDSTAMKFSKVFLEGDAQLIYTGKLHDEAWS